MTWKIERKMRKTENYYHALVSQSWCFNNPISLPLFADMQNVVLKLHQVSSQRCVYLGHRVLVFKFGWMFGTKKKFTLESPRYHCDKTKNRTSIITIIMNHQTHHHDVSSWKKPVCSKRYCQVDTLQKDILLGFWFHMTGVENCVHSLGFLGRL